MYYYFDGVILIYDIGLELDILLVNFKTWRFTPYQILVIGFASLILFGAFLLMTPAATLDGKGLSFIDALFTATSAVCVTGLVVVDTGRHFTLFGQLVIILLIQFGGLGIMTLTTLVAIVLRKRINLRERLIMQEALNQITVSGVVRLTLYLFKITLLIEAIGGTILAIRWYHDFGLIGIYYGYWHAISAFCNAGFDLFGEFRSLTSYVDDATVTLTVSTLIILGGIGFAVISDIWEHRKFSCLSLHSKIVLLTTLVLISVGAVVIYILEQNNPDTLGQLSLEGKILGSYFQSVTPRTAGFNTIDIGKINCATAFFMILLMFIGASPASTGGGIKTSTFAIVVMALWSIVRGKDEVVVFDKYIPRKTIYKAFSIMTLSAVLVISVTLFLAVTESLPFLNLLFETTSAFGTVGLSTGITSLLTPYGKSVIILTMFAGRVGPLTLAMALAFKTSKHLVRYPEGKIIIG